MSLRNCEHLNLPFFNPPDFVQRPAQRPKTASNVPLRSWWRRSSRLRDCGRATTRVRGSSWASSSRAAAVPAAVTAPYPETPSNLTEVTPGQEWKGPRRKGERRDWTGALRRRACRDGSAAPPRLCFVCTPPSQLTCHSPQLCSDKRNA